MVNVSFLCTSSQWDDYGNLKIYDILEVQLYSKAHFSAIQRSEGNLKQSGKDIQPHIEQLIPNSHIFGYIGKIKKIKGNKEFGVLEFLLDCTIPIRIKNFYHPIVYEEVFPSFTKRELISGYAELWGNISYDLALVHKPALGKVLDIIDIKLTIEEKGIDIEPIKMITMETDNSIKKPVRKVSWIRL